jgi:carbonic anhydrase
VDSKGIDYTHPDSSVTYPINEVLGMDASSMTQGKYYTYPGSLTTPNCDEIVVWTVIDQPQVATQAQIDWVKKAWAEEVPSGNDRDVQPLNDRTITVHNP